MIDLKQYLELANQDGYIDCSHDEEFEFIADALKELLWYREQDLISREDAIEKILEAGEGTTILWHEVTCDIIRSIPKAEPPIDECTPNCEKRFTCKHCIQGMYCNGRTGNEDGTPCCCEPEAEYSREKDK